MKILIAGGTGFIGRELSKLLRDRGDNVTILTRSKRKSRLLGDDLAVWEWDGKNPGPWIEVYEGLDAIINLSGVSIGSSRWSSSFKKEILSSRIDSTTILVKAVKISGSVPSVFINASAVGFYGDTDSDVTESNPAGSDFLARTCSEWERSAIQAEEMGMRTVLMRTGVVLGDRSPAVQRMILPFKLYFGGPLGSGQQWFPWVHLEDVVNAYIYALDHSEISGPVNIVSPGIVNNAEFSQCIGKILSRPSWLPVPPTILKFALGEMSDLVLKGQKALPKKLLDNGFSFSYPDAEKALEEILKS